jgi:hypothetical protein
MLEMQPSAGRDAERFRFGLFRLDVSERELWREVRAEERRLFIQDLTFVSALL